MTTVRAHQRRGTRGVRTHVREWPDPHTVTIVPRGTPLWERLDNPDDPLENTIAGVFPTDPTRIYLFDARGIGPKRISKTFAHENLHQTMTYLGEVEASYALDDLQHNRAPEASGLFRRRRKRK